MKNLMKTSAIALTGMLLMTACGNKEQNHKQVV